ncbi:MAG: SDR family NAD(P)-dependent oxidoreductase, partial [Chloroflexota bacterium]
MAETSFDLTGKVALITGGTGVLGSAMTRGLAAAGASVAILARTESKTQALAAEIQASGGHSIGIQADILDQASIQRATDQVLQSYGRIDILVNGAGGNRSDATAVPGERTFFDLSPDVLQWVFNLNFTGSVLVSQVVGKQMAQQGSGVILNISSMASF